MTQLIYQPKCGRWSRAPRRLRDGPTPRFRSLPLDLRDQDAPLRPMGRTSIRSSSRGYGLCVDDPELL